jgi:hypothetical protein
LVVFLDVFLDVGGLDGLTVFFDPFDDLGGLLPARISGNNFGKPSIFEIPAILGMPAIIEKPAIIVVSFSNFRRLGFCITSFHVALRSYGATLRYLARCR